MQPELTWRQARRSSTTSPTDLSDEQWKMIRRIIPRARRGGRKRTTSMRAVMNAIFYLIRTGCAWRYLPTSFPPWSTVYAYFARWKAQGIFKWLHDLLRRFCRLRKQRSEQAHVLLIDSQSVKCQFGESPSESFLSTLRGRFWRSSNLQCGELAKGR